MTIKEFPFSESLKNKGVTDLFLKDNEIIIQINNNPIKTKLDYDFITTINNVRNGLDIFTKNNTLKEELIFNISKNLYRFFFDSKNLAFSKVNAKDKISNEYQINSNNRINDSISFEQWQLDLKKKLDDLKQTLHQNFPDLWESIEFVLSVKNILHIKNCTLPFAGILLGSPSSAKTIGLELLRETNNTFYTDSFSAKSFVSHNTSVKREQLVNIDLLPKIKDKILLTPELSPTFSKKDDELIEILGIFIRILDGRGYESDTGAHGHRGYTGEFMFVWVGAAVDIPRKVHKYLSALGPKLYFYRIPKSKKTEQDYINELEGEEFGLKFEKIKIKMKEYLECFEQCPIGTYLNTQNNTLIKIPCDEKKDDKKAYRFIVKLAQILAPLRGTLSTWETRDTQGSEYAYSLPVIEEPSRAITQLRNLARGHALIHGRNYVTLDDIPILIQVVLSTASIERVKIFDLLLGADGQLSTSQITKALDVSANTAKRTMTEFKGLGIVDWLQEDDENGTGYGFGYNNQEKIVKLKDKFSWFLTDEFKSLRNGFSVDIEYGNKNEKVKKMSQEKIPPTTLFDTCYSNIDSQEEIKQEEEEDELYECYYCDDFSSTTNKNEYEKHVVLKHFNKNAYPGLVDLENNNLKPKGKKWEI